MRRLSLLFIALLTNCTFTWSSVNTPKIPFEKLQTNSSVELISDIIRDEQGYLWIANRGLGVVKHDSYDTKSYLYKPEDDSSLSNNVVQKIHEDRNGNIWVATLNGLNRYIPKYDNFKRYYHHKDSSQSLGHNTIYSIYEDHLSRLWIITEKSINLYSPETDRFEDYTPTSLPPSFNFLDITEDQKGNLWIVGSHSGIYSFNPTTKTAVHYSDPLLPSNSSAKSLYSDSYNNIWILDKRNGLSSFNPESLIFKIFNTLGNHIGTNGKLTYDAFQLDDEYLLVAVDQGGINRYHYPSETFDYLTTENSKSGKLSGNGIYCFHQDKEGILWVGTSRSGINYYNNKKQRFNTLQQNRLIPNESLVFNVTSNFFQSSDNRLWIGTDGGGISVLDMTTGNIQNIPVQRNQENGLSSGVIRKFTEDHDHNIIVATYEKGLFKIDPSSMKVTEKIQLHYQNKPKEQLIHCFFKDNKNRYWLGEPQGGITLFDSLFQEKAGFFQEESLSGIRRTYITQDKNGDIFASNNEGVYLYNESNKKLEKIINTIDNTWLFPSTVYFYIGTKNNGLYIYDKEYRLVKHIDQHNGLSNNSVASILESDDGMIWIATLSGLTSISSDFNTYTQYFKKDGLQGNKFFLQSAIKEKSGHLFFGGINGITRFHPSDIVKNLTPTPVFINSLSVNNKRVKTGSNILNESLESTKKITLSYKQNTISFGFSGISFTYPMKNTYEYKLEGFDKRWFQTEANNRIATYTNLDPGVYTFKVTSFNNDHIRNDKIAELTIIITPPFWQRAWFYIFSILTLLASSFWLVLRREKKLNVANEELQKNVNERTKEISLQKQLIEDRNEQLQKAHKTIQQKNHNLNNLNSTLEEKVRSRTKDLEKTTKDLLERNNNLQQFNYIVSHNIRGPLANIKGLVSLYNLNTPDDPINLIAIDKIKHSVGKLDEVLIDLSKILDIRQAIDNKVELIQLDQLVKSIVSSLDDQINASEVIIETQLEETNIQSVSALWYSIFINLISNAIKYRDKNRALQINITSTRKKNNLILTFQDTGMGIDLEKHGQNLFGLYKRFHPNIDGRGIGLFMVKTQVESLGGMIDIESEVSRGTKFTITIEHFYG